MARHAVSDQVDLSLAAGRLPRRQVTVGRGDAAYQAFVPHPLPPDIAYDGRLVALLSDADRALGELNGLGRMLPNPDLLISPFVHREAVLSSKIEGTQASVSDVYALEAGQAGQALPSRRPSADVQEVANYIDSLRYGLERTENFPLSLRLFCELHQRLMEGVRGNEARPGEFRSSQNWIGAPGCLLKDAIYVPPPPSELTEALGRLELYLNADDEANPPLVRLALIHGQFEMIHPFLDGNGRIGRLLLTLLLVQWGLLALPLLYLSAFFERRRTEYYQRLLAISREGAWEPWIAYFLEGVRTEALDAAQRAKRLQDLQHDWRARFTSIRGTALTLRLVDALFEGPIVTIPRAQAILGVTYPSAKAHVDELVLAGILSPFGRRAYGKAFAAEQILRIIDS